MSAPPFAAKRFLLTASGELLNVDYVVRLHVAGGKLVADMASGPAIEVLPDLSQVDDLRRLLPLNGRAP